MKIMEENIFDGWWLYVDKVLDKIKEILVIEKFDNTKISINADDKLPNDITLRNVLILITCIIKDDNKFTRNYS